MAGNLRALSDEELEYINKTYTFELFDFEKNYRNIYKFVEDKLDDTSKKELLDIIDSMSKNEGKFIVVTTNNYQLRKILHSSDESFIISSPKRKITFSVEAINYWINDFKEDYTLIDVQNAINILTVTYQTVNKEEIRKQLERKSSKIKSM